MLNVMLMLRLLSARLSFGYLKKIKILEEYSINCNLSMNY